LPNSRTDSRCKPVEDFLLALPSSLPVAKIFH
jgi:hypothetical protein